MKRSEVINRGRPRPLDQAVNQIYSNYLLLLQEIVNNWKQELVGGLIGQRFYEDVKDVRADVTKNGEIVLRLKPVIGFDTQEEVSFYVDFFKMYKKLTNTLLSTMMCYYRHEYYGLDKKLISKSLREASKTWEIQQKHRIHQLFMTLKILVSSMNLEQLKAEDLYRFDIDAFIARDEFDIFVASMDALVRDYRMGDYISSQFSDNQASFYHYPDSILLEAYYRYAKAIISPKPLKRPGATDWSNCQISEHGE